MPERDPLGILADLATEQKSEIQQRLDSREPERATMISAIGGVAARRRRRRIAIAAVAALAATGGSVAAVAIWQSQPADPTDGIVCRSAASLDSDMLVIAPAADPTAACADAWRAVDLPALDGQQEPALTACIGLGGAIEVFPGPSTVCDDLGLTAADPNLSPDNLAVVALNERLINEINLADCATTDDVAARTRSILDDEGFHHWTITIDPNWADSTCAKATLDPAIQTAHIAGLPEPPPTNEGNS